MQGDSYLGPTLAGLGGDLHGVLGGGGKAVEDGGLMRKDAVVRICHVLEHEREVDREVADEVVACPARLIQFRQPWAGQR